MQSPAVALFVERAQAVHADFVIKTDNADIIARVCRRLGGLPLAIEFVAARASVLTPDALLERLDGGVLLDSGSIHDLPDRHRTMRAAIAWSYELQDWPGLGQRFVRRHAGAACALGSAGYLIESSGVQLTRDDRMSTTGR